VFLAVLVGGSIGLNRLTGDSWGQAFETLGIALGAGVAVGGAYYIWRRFAKVS
jgi:hypothetical protein